MDLTTFVARWQRSQITERAAAQSHFLDLCELLQKPKPAEVDATGENYAFEKGVAKTGGGKGFADVWMRGHFAIEYKGKRKNLTDAYSQLLNYREDLENPPLLMVCDLNNFEVHTNFTGTVKKVFQFNLQDLLDGKPTAKCSLPPLEVLRALFEDPARLKPDRTTAQVTEEAAREFGSLAASLANSGVEAQDAARFLIRILFCLFAEDIQLLPTGLFTKMLQNFRTKPPQFARSLQQLFQEMATGGVFGGDPIKHFNGGLFTDDQVFELSEGDLTILAKAAALDWGSVEPSIFGTLFERSLDPTKRSQLGAHYTSLDDILLIVEPVLMAPLRREWADVQEKAQIILAKRSKLRSGQQTGVRLTAAELRTENQIDTELSRLLQTYSEKLGQIKVLDPACGSGNFLYVALKQLLDLNKAVISFAAACNLSGFFPHVQPEQMRGIEMSDYAQILAPVTVWIGYIQWLRDNGFGQPAEPILRRMDAVLHMDAVLSVGSDGSLSEPAWPDADVIIGNPPFLGGNRVRQELGDRYVDALFTVYSGKVPAAADLVCYFFEKARGLVARGSVQRVGLLATQAIRGGANRSVLDRIKDTGDIFWAWSDRNWILEGANVHVSMVGFDNGTESRRELNGNPVTAIFPNLTSNIDLTKAERLPENQGICFMGPSPKARFDIDAATAKKMLEAPINVNGRHNSDVVRPVASAIDLVQGARNLWTIDFGLMSEDAAAFYELPFQYIKATVFPTRSRNRREAYAKKWWQYAEARPGMRHALQELPRYFATPGVAKHRIFVWMRPDVLCNQGTLVFARSDDYFFGVLQSRVHELWALSKGTQLREIESGFRYTPTTTFETFPLPWVPGDEPINSSSGPDFALLGSVSDNARVLVQLRDNWLNPEGASASELATRTLTNLYNLRPEWLKHAHNRLDNAVYAAYGWPADIGDADVLTRLYALNQERAARTGTAFPD